MSRNILSPKKNLFVLFVLFVALYGNGKIPQAIILYEYTGYTPYESDSFSFKYVISYFTDGLIKSIDVFSYVSSTRQEKPVYSFQIIRDSLSITRKRNFSKDMEPAYIQYYLSGNNIEIDQKNDDHSIIPGYSAELLNVNGSSDYQYIVNGKPIASFSFTREKVIFETVMPPEKYIYSVNREKNIFTIEHQSQHRKRFDIGNLSSNSYFIRQWDIDDGPLLRSFRIVGIGPSSTDQIQALNFLLFSNWFIAEAVFPFIIGMK